MPSTVPRETFIALRARRQAYQIASSIRDPHLISDSTELPVAAPQQPIEYEQRRPAWQLSRTDKIVLLVVLDLLIIVMAIALSLG